MKFSIIIINLKISTSITFIRINYDEIYDKLIIYKYYISILKKMSEDNKDNPKKESSKEIPRSENSPYKDSGIKVVIRRNEDEDY